MSKFAPFVREILGSALSSHFDPAPITFRRSDERGVRPVRYACQDAPDALHDLATPLNRNAFLCGCLDFTEIAVIEHLIVGFGSKYGATTRVTHLAHLVGDEHSVSIPEPMGSAIEAHVGTTHRAEALIFHNHPANALNAIFDNLPLPSAADRNAALYHMLQPLVAFKAILGGGRVRYYLGENGFVREFCTPELLTLIESISKRTGGARL